MPTNTEIITFADCLREAASNPDLVREFDRLAGTGLSRLAQRSALDRMIDEATGYERDQVLLFAAFVFEVVYLRLVQPEGVDHA